MSKKFFLKICLLLMLSACSSGLLYNDNVKLSSIKAKSAISGFTVSVPFGWYEVTNNTESFTDILLVDDAQSAALSFNPVNAELKSVSRTKPQIEQIRDLIISLKKSHRKRNIQITSTNNFELNGKMLAAFEYTADQKIFGRTVVFRYGDKYYECTAESNSVQAVKQIPKAELFSIQNSVLHSVR